MRCPNHFDTFVRILQTEKQIPTFDELASMMHMEETNQTIRAQVVNEEALVMRIKCVIRQGRFRNNSGGLLQATRERDRTLPTALLTSEDVRRTH